MRLNYKIHFVLFICCLLFIGLGIFEIMDKGLKTGTKLFWQFSHFLPFVIGIIVFGSNLFSKRIKN
jgi:hypothetical protein